MSATTITTTCEDCNPVVVIASLRPQARREGLLDEVSVPVAYLLEGLRCSHGTLCCELRNQVPSIGKPFAEARSQDTEADWSYS